MQVGVAHAHGDRPAELIWVLAALCHLGRSPLSCRLCPRLAELTRDGRAHARAGMLRLQPSRGLRLRHLPPLQLLRLLVWGARRRGRLLPRAGRRTWLLPAALPGCLRRRSLLLLPHSSLSALLLASLLPAHHGRQRLRLRAVDLAALGLPTARVACLRSASRLPTLGLPPLSSLHLPSCVPLRLPDPTAR